MALPDKGGLLREWCKSSPTTDWFWNFARFVDSRKLQKWLSLPVLNPQSLDRLIASVPDRLRHIPDAYSYRQKKGVDVALASVLAMAGRSLSTPNEILLSSLCGDCGDYQPMRLALGVVVRDEEVRLDQGSGWKERFDAMKNDPQILKELLAGNRLSLNAKDKYTLSHDEFISALKNCYLENDIRYKGVNFTGVAASQLIDAYAENFGVYGLQLLLDKDRESEHGSVLEDLGYDLMQYINQKILVIEREYNPVL